MLDPLSSLLVFFFTCLERDIAGDQHQVGRPQLLDDFSRIPENLVANDLLIDSVTSLFAVTEMNIGNMQPSEGVVIHHFLSFAVDRGNSNRLLWK
ncbi:MAG: hypothetical protein P9G45_14755 [Candidatus Contendobacter sp.]|nr:hypothetical protein [Candidatus Contendobacter sp.]